MKLSCTHNEWQNMKMNGLRLRAQMKSILVFKYIFSLQNVQFEYLFVYQKQ